MLFQFLSAFKKYCLEYIILYKKMLYDNRDINMQIKLIEMHTYLYLIG